MASKKQIINELKKSFEVFQLDKAISLCENESQTRMYLIEPVFSILRYNTAGIEGTLFPEYNADFGDRTSKKVDYAILLDGKKPEIIIEAKKAGQKLNDTNVRQLNEYFMYTNDAKIGILTNGTQYQFFTRNNNSKTSLNPTPFFTFDLLDYDSTALEMLSMFYRTDININDILKEAEEIYFLNQFEDAFVNELADPSRDLIKAVYTRMGGQRLTEQNEKQIKELINSVSIKSALDKLIVKEASSTNSGIITTDEELKVYHVVKTIIAQHKKIDTSSIGYRDLKGKFSILLDDNQNKKICDLYISSNSKKIEIDGEKFEITDMDSIIKLKKKLTERTLSLI
jgi:hypothetical protein